MSDRDANSLRGAIDVRDVALERLQVIAGVVPEDAGQQVFLAIEIEVDGPIGDAGRLGDLGHLRVELAALREYIGCRAEDPLSFTLRPRNLGSDQGLPGHD